MTRVRIYLVNKKEAEGICYSVQLGAFSRKENAERFVGMLAKEGIKARVEKIGEYYKVYSGHFKSKERARSFGLTTGREFFVVNCH
nr:SPOR domain-containing protein [Thermotomaculum hydrothermale]